MKHNLPSARIAGSIVAIAVAALVVFVSACTTPPRLSKSVQYQSDSSSFATGAAININSASAVELEKLPGIGKGIAERIIDHRERYGEFRRAEHLLMVRGISDRKFRAIRSMISV